MTSKEKIERLEARNNELHAMLDDVAASLNKRIEASENMLLLIEEQRGIIENLKKELQSRPASQTNQPKQTKPLPEFDPFYGDLEYKFRLSMVTMHELLFIHYDPKVSGIDLSKEAVNGIGAFMGMALEAITGEPMYESQRQS